MEDFETIWEILDKHLTGTTVETLAHGVSNEILCFDDEGMWRLSERSRFNEKTKVPKTTFLRLWEDLERDSEVELRKNRSWRIAGACLVSIPGLGVEVISTSPIILTLKRGKR